MAPRIVLQLMQIMLALVQALMASWIADLGLRIAD